MTNTTFKNTQYLLRDEDYSTEVVSSTDFKVTELEERVVIEEDGDCLWAVVKPAPARSNRR